MQDEDLIIRNLISTAMIIRVKFMFIGSLRLTYTNNVPSID
jgi:hypothetical protein